MVIIMEIKLPNPDRIDFEDYLESYEDLKEAFGDNVQRAQQHWISIGHKEGRHIKLKDIDYDKLIKYVKDIHIPKESTNTFNLITSMYNEKDEKRHLEYAYALQLNLLNPLIENIYVYYDISDGDFNFFKKFNIDTKYKSKLSIIKCYCRPSYATLFNFSNITSKGKWIISNGDIVFTGDLNKIPKLNDSILAVTRWEFISENELSIFNFQDGPNVYSQDTWIYETPIKYPDITYKIRLGQILCDSNIIECFKEFRTPLYNPCKDFKTLHLHLQNKRTQNYTNVNDSEFKYFDKNWPHSWPKVNPCNLKDIR
jgi:hypothetical protein